MLICDLFGVGGAVPLKAHKKHAQKSICKSGRLSLDVFYENGCTVVLLPPLALESRLTTETCAVCSWQD